MVKVAILHEGNSKKTNDNKLIKLLLDNLKLNEEEVRFFGLGTKSNFFKKNSREYKELLEQIEEDNINKILFVVDADYEENDKIYGGYDNTVKEINVIRNKLSLTDISDIYITCDPQTKNGYLESLILSSIPKKEKECIEIFLDCSKFESKENHKAILNQIYKTAYPKAPFDFSHKNFDELKTKLKNLFKWSDNE